MIETSGHLARRARELRLDFDRSFAAPPRSETVETTDFLAIRIGTEAAALRLSEIAGLYVDKEITRVPGTGVALIGIAGFRGTILPVYSLSGLLGLKVIETPRWLVVAAGASLALAFEGFEGHLRIDRASILPQQAVEGHFHAREYVRAHALVRPIIDLPSVLRGRPEGIKTEEG
jgi:chemotaxis signal transduction protein